MPTGRRTPAPAVAYLETAGMADTKPKLTKAERDAKREERIRKLHQRCKQVMGSPCGHDCTRGCARIKRADALAAQVRDSKIRQAITLGARRKLDFERSDARRTEQLALDLAAYQVEPKRQLTAGKQMSKSDIHLEQWRVEVLFLLGLTKEQIASELYGAPGVRVGAINKIMTKGRLVERRRDRPVDRLIELDQAAPHGMTGMVMSEAARFNRGLLKAIEHRRGIVPEQQLRAEGERAFKRMVNQNASQLHVAARSGKIREWNVLAGLELQAIRAGSAAGRVGTIDFTKDIVDGGKINTDGRVVSAMEAAETISLARSKVLEAFGDTTGPWRWAVIEHVVLSDRPLSTYPLPFGMSGDPATFLNDALEPVAIIFRLVPSGISPRAPSAADVAASVLRTAILAHRDVRLAEGTLAETESAKRESAERRRRLFGG